MRPKSTYRSLTLICLLLAAPGLAGCIGTAQATAMEEQSTAQTEAAEAWSQDAELATVHGMEGSWSDDGMASGHEGYWSQAQEDDRIGDGHCELWEYTFVSASKPDQVFTVVVDKDGEILHTGTDQRDDDVGPLGTWNIDSDEALETAMDVNPSLEEGTSKANFGLVMSLEHDEGDENAHWFIAGGGGDESGGAGGFVEIDAVTGEVLNTRGGSSAGYGGWGNAGGWGR